MARAGGRNAVSLNVGQTVVMKNEKQLTPRRKPKQRRSVKRTQQILEVTARLLDKVGFDDLTTILITKELGISVGSLYHYFPNKHAILYAIAEDWLREWDKLLVDIAQLPIERMSLPDFVEQLSKTFLIVYREQKGILPLIQAMYAVPELRDLDEKHDRSVVLKMSLLFKRVGVKLANRERERIAFCYLEIVHAMLIVVLEQKKGQANKSLSDLDRVCLSLIEHYM